MIHELVIRMEVPEDGAPMTAVEIEGGALGADPVFWRFTAADPSSPEIALTLAKFLALCGLAAMAGQGQGVRGGGSTTGAPTGEPPTPRDS